MTPTTAPTATTARPTIDVSHLPAESRDGRSPMWWGNVLFMLIETTTVALLLASYVYLWRNYPQSGWPPPAAQHDPPLLKPVPDLPVGTANLLVLLATVPLMLWVDRACQRQFDALERRNAATPSEVPRGRGRPPPERPAGVLLGLLVLVALGAGSLVLRWHEFPALKVQWNENAYAALVWTMLGLHLLYVAIEVVELAVMLLWTALYGLGQNQATDVILTAAYWYWTVVVGAVLYGAVYWFPRLV
ncbi:cytochrome c oxidase subunit 3 [Gemmata sp.]|uniref:cytochrome c oxidase subunit 3 n=1 Tax=Gemmata sp. TaxID=1914242 RepID=UPI003F70EE39